jgi:RimJ/RimL family protein N-acetyltransferase
VPGSGGLARGGPPLLSVRVGVRVHWYLGRQDVRMSDICPPIAAPLGDVTTERLLLCRFDRDVLDELACVFDSREVWEFPYGRGMTRAETAAFLEAQIRHWEDFGFGCWMARERQGECLIGYVGLSIPTFLPEILPAVEVGWRFAPTSWGNGYATEGATAALDEAFSTLGLTSVCSLPQADNRRSVRVAERLNMKLVREASVPANDQRGEVVVSHFEISRDEWQGVRRLP